MKHTYDPVAKLLHWATAALLVVQYLVGWLMPDIRRGMSPGIAMNLHMSFGICLLMIVLIRYAWRFANPVRPEASLPAWQRASSHVVHHVLYVLLLATMITGWTFASMRGWTITVFGIVPLTPLVGSSSEIGRAIGRLHGVVTWMLLIVIVEHVLAAFLHRFVYRDRVMQRMLPSVGSPPRRRLLAGVRSGKHLADLGVQLSPCEWVGLLSEDIASFRHETRHKITPALAATQGGLETITLSGAAGVRAGQRPRDCVHPSCGRHCADATAP